MAVRRKMDLRGLSGKSPSEMVKEMRQRWRDLNPMYVFEEVSVTKDQYDSLIKEGEDLNDNLGRDFDCEEWPDDSLIEPLTFRGVPVVASLNLLP